MVFLDQQLGAFFNTSWPATQHSLESLLSTTQGFFNLLEATVTQYVASEPLLKQKYLPVVEQWYHECNRKIESYHGNGVLTRQSYNEMVSEFNSESKYFQIFTLFKFIVKEKFKLMVEAIRIPSDFEA